MGLKSVSVTTKMGAGMKIECHAGKHTLYIDQPPAAGGSDAGPTPLEFYQLSLAGCLSSVARIVAKQQSIDLRSMEVVVSGSLDTDVLLGKRNDLRAGFEELAVTVTVNADLTPEQKREFLEEVERRCPVSENTKNPTPVRLVIK